MKTKNTNTTTDDHVNDVITQVTSEMKIAGIDYMDNPEIVENPFLHLSFYSPYDTSTFLNIVSGNNKLLSERILQESKMNNWEYCIHPAEISDDPDNPDILFSTCIIVPLSDVMLVLKALKGYNQSLTKGKDVKSDS